MVADLEQLGKVDASEFHAKRLNAKEMISPKLVKHLYSRVADGEVKFYA